MFFALKQVLFVLITLLVAIIGVFLLKAVAVEFIDHLTKGGGNLVESLVSFFVGLFVVLLLGILLIFLMAVFASFLASVLINYLLTEMDEIQRNKSVPQRLLQSIVPPLAGIVAVILSSLFLTLLIPSAESYPLLSILQFLLVYLPVNYYFDKKYYLQGLVSGT